jgi:hypothetical protein
MPPIPPEHLEEHIQHATTRKFNPDNDGPTDYSHAERVFAYLAEQLAQCHALMLWEISTEIRKKVMQNLGFYSTAVGRVAELEGATRPSAYNGYNTDKGNQVDIFLEKIGYKK